MWFYNFLVCDKCLVTRMDVLCYYSSFHGGGRKRYDEDDSDDNDDDPSDLSNDEHDDEDDDEDVEPDEDRAIEKSPEPDDEEYDGRETRESSTPGSTIGSPGPNNDTGIHCERVFHTIINIQESTHSCTGNKLIEYWHYMCIHIHHNTNIL